MIDMYLIITPLFSVLTLCSLLAIKFTLKGEARQIDPLLFKDNVPQSRQNQISQINQQASPITSTFCFMIKNCTLAEIFVIRKAKNKIPMLMTLSIVGFLCYLIPSIYMFIFIGTIVNVVFLITRLFRSIKSNKQQQKSPNVIVNESIQGAQQNAKVKQYADSQKTCEHVFYTLSGVFSIGLLTFLSIWFFKDYKNQILQQFLINFAVNCSIDFFSVQPIVYLILSLPLSRSQRMQEFIKSQEKINQFESLSLKQIKKIERQQIGFQTAAGISPRKKRLSPSKIPKAFDMNMFDKDKVTSVKKSKLQSRLTEDGSKLKKQNQDLSVAIQMSKKVKKQRKQLNHLMTPSNRNQRTQETQEALNNTNQQLKVGTPIAQMRNRDNDDLNSSSQYPRNSFNFPNRTIEPERERPTNDRHLYIKKVKTQHDQQKKIAIKSPNLKSPIKSPYEAQFKQYQREISDENEKSVRNQGTASVKNTLNKSRTDSVELRVTRNARNLPKQAAQDQLVASTEIIKMNMKKKIQDMQMTNQQRINRFNLQVNSKISVNHEKSDRKSQKNNSFISKQNGESSIIQTIQSNIDHSRNKKLKIAHNNFNNDCNENLQLDQTPNKLFGKKTLSDASDIQGANYVGNKINLIGRNINIIDHRDFDESQLNQNSDQQGIQDRMAGNYIKKKNSIGLNESFECQRDKNGPKNTLLQIREQTQHQIEQIDLNSPEKRRKNKLEGLTPNRQGYVRQGYVRQGYNSTKRPPKRKFSSGNRRVIKFSNGEPYLQYLPNMLSKEIQKNQKNSRQQIKIKQETQYDKKRKSVRRLRNTKDPMVPNNDQNDCPQFKVEDL